MIEYTSSINWRSMHNQPRARLTEKVLLASFENDCLCNIEIVFANDINADKVVSEQWTHWQYLEDINSEVHEIV